VVDSTAFGMNKRRVRARPGVSEVIGALLLIIVVVTAVASLSYFLATASQNSENRSNYLTDLKNENFQVVYASFSPAGGPWTQVVLSVRNANTVSSGLQGILVNGAYITKWFQVNSSGSSASVVSILGAKIAPLLIPAKATEYIMLNYSAGSLPGPLLANQPLQITLVTQSGNYFRANWSPPVALASASVSKSFQAVPQDELSLSGVQSYAGNGTVVGYSWTVSVPESCASPTGPQDVASGIIGETLAYAPEALFTNWSADCISGPITATLTVTDSNGFTATSQPVVVPPDPALAPPASLTLFSENTDVPLITTYNIAVQVSDVYGRPVAGQVVTAVCYGNVTLASNTADTNGNGQAVFTVTVTTVNPVGSVLFQVASVPQLEVVYPQTYNPL
jgi:hypothetical protein